MRVSKWAGLKMAASEIPCVIKPAVYLSLSGIEISSTLFTRRDC